MPYFPDLNTYLHQSSLLIQAYPTTTRITTKYSLPRKPNPEAKSKPPPPPAATTRSPTEPANPAVVPDTTTATTSDTTPPATTTTVTPKPSKPPRERLPPSATLTLKTFEPGSGICLKYKTDKAAEVGRLLTGLGRLAGGEVIEMPAPAPAPASGAAVAAAADKMEVDEVVVGSGTATPSLKAGEDAKVLGQSTQAQGGAGGAGAGAKGKKKRMTGKK